MNRQAFKVFVLFRPLFRRIGFGDDGDAETQFGRLFQALLAARGGAYFTGQAHFTEGDEAFGQRLASQAGSNRQHHCQIGRGLADADTAYCIDEDVLIHASHSGVAMQNS